MLILYEKHLESIWLEMVSMYDNDPKHTAKYSKRTHTTLSVMDWDCVGQSY